jgi:hypothetical protein
MDSDMEGCDCGGMDVADLTGLWRRSLLSFPDGRRDESSAVAWLQAGRLFADLRQPAGMPDFSHVAGLHDLSREDCLWLAGQQAFAGTLRKLDDCVEWVRELDFQPEGPVKDIGRLFWDGDILVEEGRDVAYREHWHLDAPPASPCVALRLRAASRLGFLVRLGGVFMYARGRPAALPAGADLAACVAAAPDLAAARALLDCEVSIGTVAGAWRIERSTLPFRVGDDLAPRSQAGRLAVGDEAAREWDVVAAEGDTLTLFDVSAETS